MLSTNLMTIPNLTVLIVMSSLRKIGNTLLQRIGLTEVSALNQSVLKKTLWKSLPATTVEIRHFLTYEEVIQWAYSVANILGKIRGGMVGKTFRQKHGVSKTSMKRMFATMYINHIFLPRSPTCCSIGAS